MNKYYEPTEAGQRAYNDASTCGLAQQGKNVQPIAANSIVRDLISANEETLAELHDTISRLEGRLETALTPMPPQPAAATSGPSAPPCSHVAVRLGSLNEGYRHAAARLRELTQRVEV